MVKAQKPEAAPTNLPRDAAPGFAEPQQQPLTGMAALDQGRTVVRRALKTAPVGPGVYRMLDISGDVLYVGKAKNLRNRLQSYANASGVSPRILRMIGLTAAVEVISTHTEVEALLLESNMIKRLRPAYNILLRDDKSFPFIVITEDHDWPELAKHRGSRQRKGQYFGPFASAGAVNRTLNTLQKIFLLRTCSDSVFAARTRPCLQYQIKRCAAPCVGRISSADYADLVTEASQFLHGRQQAVQKQMSERMLAASDAMDFEQAAVYRDRLKALAHVQSHQGINVDAVAEADVIAGYQMGGQTCIQVFFFRAGQNWGNRAYFPAHSREATLAEVLAAFLGQFYDDKPPPPDILLSDTVPEQAVIEAALTVKADRKVRLLVPQRGQKRELIDTARHNAKEALSRRLAESASQRKLLDALAEVLDLSQPLNRIEVYDNSHIQGAHAIGAMIAVGPEGFDKSGYRKFNMKSKSLVDGDDYAMMREVLTRRFKRLLQPADPEEDKKVAGDDGTGDDGAGDDGAGDNGAGENRAASAGTEVKKNQAKKLGPWPDLVLIDGGRGQLSVAEDVFQELGITDVALAAIAKGVDRNAGRERLFLPDRPAISLEPKSTVLYFLQRIRDESHRFVIGSHRQKRAKSLRQSLLDEVPNVGPRRKRQLLTHFGSAKAVEQAALSDLERVEGISRKLAQQIYDYFHGQP